MSLSLNYTGGIRLEYRQRCIIQKQGDSSSSYGVYETAIVEYPYFCHSSYTGRVDRLTDSKERIWAHHRRFIFQYDPILEQLRNPIPSDDGVVKEPIILVVGDNIEYKDDIYIITSLQMTVAAHNLSAYGIYEQRGA